MVAHVGDPSKVPLKPGLSRPRPGTLGFTPTAALERTRELVLGPTRFTDAALLRLAREWLFTGLFALSTWQIATFSSPNAIGNLIRTSQRRSGCVPGRGSFVTGDQGRANGGQRCGGASDRAPLEAAFLCGVLSSS